MRSCPPLARTARNPSWRPCRTLMCDWGARRAQPCEDAGVHGFLAGLALRLPRGLQLDGETARFAIADKPEPQAKTPLFK